MTTSRLFPFRVQVTPTGKQPYHTPFRTREEMQKGITDLVRERTVGKIEPFIHTGETWVVDTPTREWMERTYSNNGHFNHKEHFKAASILFAQLAKVERLSEAQCAELYEVVESAFKSAGVKVPHDDPFAVEEGDIQ